MASRVWSKDQGSVWPQLPGTRACVVIPSDYTYKQNGKPVKEAGALFTFALQKGQTGWRITGWAWAKR